MLVLSRRPGEVLRIGEDIVITVLGIKGYQISLGIAAPRNVPVDRKEVYNRKLREAAAHSTADTAPALVDTEAPPPSGD